MCEHELLITEKLICWTVGDDGSLIENDGSGTKLDDHFEIMCCNDLSRRDGLECLDQTSFTAWVKITRWLVESEYSWLASQDSSQTHPPFLSTAQMMR
jgi:hypothetical protein